MPCLKNKNLVTLSKNLNYRIYFGILNNSGISDFSTYIQQIKVTKTVLHSTRQIFLNGLHFMMHFKSTFNPPTVCNRGCVRNLKMGVSNFIFIMVEIASILLEFFTKFLKFLGSTLELLKKWSCSAPLHTR